MRFRAPVETKVVKCKFKDQEDTGTTLDEDTVPTLLLMKTKVIKRKFEDQEDTGTTPDEDAAAAAADAFTPATPPHGGAAAAAGRVELPPAPSTASGPVPSPGAWALRASGRHGVVGRMQGPKADAD